jgi:hypothetical protein
MRDFFDSEAGQLIVLSAGLFIYSLFVLFCAWAWPGNEKLFALFAGIVGNFNGALIMYFRMRRGPKPPEQQ